MLRLLDGTPFLKTSQPEPEPEEIEHQNGGDAQREEDRPQEDYDGDYEIVKHGDGSMTSCLLILISYSIC